MAQIKKLQIDDETLYPVTIPQAVVDPDSNKTTREELDGKVDKVTGKQLSTEDYTTAEKSKVTNLPLNTTSELALKFDKTSLESARSQSTTKAPTSKLLDDELNKKTAHGYTSQAKTLLKVEMGIGMSLDYNAFINKLVGYLGAVGELDPTDIGYVTEYIDVTEGQVYHYDGGWQVSSVVGMVWGYDANLLNPVKLVAAAATVSQDFTIPAGVAKIRAWVSKNYVGVYSLYLKSNYKNQILENKAEITNLQYNIESVTSSTDTTSLADVAKVDTGTRNWLIVNNNSYISKQGYLSKVRFKANSTNCKFYVVVLEKILTKYRINRAQLITATTTGINDVQCSLEIKPGEYIGVQGTGVTGDELPVYGNAVAGSGGWIWSTTASSIASPVGSLVTLNALPNYTLSFGFEVLHLNFNLDKLPEVVHITATRNVADYNSIREIIAGINDASETKKYIIHVPKGRWFESDLQGKRYVSIVGDDMYESVLYCDGTSANITPADYAYPAYANMALSSIAKAYKHCFFAKKDIDIENLTIEVNDAKYCMHLDANENNDLVRVRKCRLIAEANVNHPVGIGLWGTNVGQQIYFNECEFIVSGESSNGVFIHNWNNQKFPTKFKAENCKFINCGFAIIDELGSDQNDEYDFINCHSDAGGNVSFMVDVNSEGKTFWTNPATGLKETDPQVVPYCIKVNLTGSNVGLIRSLSFSTGSIDSRPLALNYCVTDYYSSVKVSGVSVGDCLQGYTNGTKNQFVAYNGSSNFAGVAIQDTDSDGFAKITTLNRNMKIVDVPVDGSFVSYPQPVKLNATTGRFDFEASYSSDTIGFAIAYSRYGHSVCLK